MNGFNRYCRGKLPKSQEALEILHFIVTAALNNRSTEIHGPKSFFTSSNARDPKSSISLKNSNPVLNNHSTEIHGPKSFFTSSNARDSKSSISLKNSNPESSHGLPVMKGTKFPLGICNRETILNYHNFSIIGLIDQSHNGKNNV